MKALVFFASQFGAKILLNSEFLVEKAQRYYLLNSRLKKISQSEFFYCGLYLGKVKNGVFFPSFNLLNMLVGLAANKVVLDRKSAWLFICGRDVFRKGVVKGIGSLNKDDCSLVLNEYGECLGFGRINAKVGESGNAVFIRNVLDVGDFLRRER
jgi:ribosome biogenesis protein Nip4